MDRFYNVLGGLVTIVVLSSSAQGATRFAKVSATGLANCSTWADACTLTNAIAAAGSGDQVWVAAGTYAPFELKEGVKIIGGFAGTETAASQSNPVTHVTIVDGGGVNRAVYGANQSASTMLRGFKITHGFDGDDQGGGGMMLSDSSALIVQCIFENNTASIMGGAVMVSGPGRLGSPQFINCIFRNNGSISANERTYEGGAVYLANAAPVAFTNCLFHGNKAGGGGGVAKTLGSYAIFTNCTMTNNQATMRRGGAIRDPATAASLRNCILWGNTRVEGEGTSADQIDSPGNDQVTYSDVEGGWPGTGNINADPLFLNASVGNYGISSSSPCKNVGSNGTLPTDVGDLDWDGNTGEVLPNDLPRNARVVYSGVDMGAYEFGCYSVTTDCDQSGVPDACEIEADPTLDCHNHNGVPDRCESGVPKGACCIGATCDWPQTECRCAASSGIWHQGNKCKEVTCEPGDE